MPGSYPSVGLKIDLNEIVAGTDKLHEMRRAYVDLGEAAAANAGKVSGAARRGAAAEAESNTKTIADAQRGLRMKMALTQQEFTERTRLLSSGNAAEDRATQQTLALRQRMWRQRIDAAVNGTAAEARAAKAAVAEEERSFKYLNSVKIRSFQMEAAEKERASAAEARAAKAAVAAEERSFGYLHGVKMRSLQMEEQAARQAGEAQRREAGLTFAFQQRMTAQRNREAAASRLGGTVTAPGFSGPAAEAGLLASVFGPLGAGIGKINGAFSGLRNTLGAVRSAFFDVRTAVGLLLGGMIVLPIVRMADAMTALEARTSFYAARASDVPYTFEAIYQAAQRARAPLEAIATLYTRLAPMGKQLGRNQTQILSISETVAKGAQVGGATTEEAKASSQQLAQALASNRFGGDELRSVAENAPILLAKIAEHFKMNTGEFIKWAHSGKANAKVVVEALEDAKTSIDALFAKMPVTVGQATTLVANAFTHLVGEVNKATGLSSSVAHLIAGFAGFLEAKSTIDAVSAAINGFGAALKLFGGAASTALSFLPALAAALLAMTAARVVPPILLAINEQLIAMQAIKGFTGVSYLTQGLGGLRAAGVGVLGGLKGLLALVGGPMGAAFIAGAAAVNYMTNAEKAAAKAGTDLKTSQQDAIGALNHAIAFTDAYGMSNANLKKSIDEVIKASGGAAVEAKKGASANDEAMEAAKRRMEIERLLTLNILERAAADAKARGGEARGAIGGLNLKAQGLALSLNSSDPAVAAMAKKGYDRALADIKRAGDASAQEFRLAEMLEKSKVDVITGKGAPTAPGAADPAAAGNAAGTTSRGMAGAINAVEKLKAEVMGLKAEVASISANPLSALAAQIEKAGAEAAAQRTAGKGRGFQDEARSLAMQKEELTIRKGLLQASADNQRQSDLEARSTQIEADARSRAAAALVAYYQEGSLSFTGYQRALDAAADAETKARVAQAELSIATRFGTDRVSDISAAYQKYLGVSKAVGDQVQAGAQAELDAAAAKEIGAGAVEKLTRAEEAYAAALERAARARKESADLAKAAGQTPAERSAEPLTQIFKDEILAKELARAKAEGDIVRISEQEAEVRGRILALVQQQIDETNQLKISITNSIRDAFIDTGKLDFKSLKEGLKRAMRQAVYDSLIAKPIQIIVTAVVDVVTDQIKKSLAAIWRQIQGIGSPGEGGGTFSKLFSKLGEMIGGKPKGGADASFEELTGQTIKMTETMGKIGTALKTVGQVLAYSETGQSLVTAASDNPRWTSDEAKLGSTIGSAIGFAIAGPIGAVIGSILGTLAGGLLGGKPSNYGAQGDRQADGGFKIWGNKRTAETNAAAEAMGQATAAAEKALTDAGITAAEKIVSFNIGTRDPTRVVLSGGRTLSTAMGDPGGAIDNAMKEILKGATYASEIQKKMAETMIAAGQSFDDIIVALAKFGEALNFGKSIGREILKYTDPKAYAVANLRDSQEKRRQQLADYGTGGFLSIEQLKALNEQLKTLDGLELADTLKQFADGVGGATASLADFQREQARIKEFTQGLLSGSLSPLSPAARLAYDQQQFGAAYQKAQGGDYGALQSLTGLAQTYLQEAQGYYGSTSAYSDIFNSVKSSLDAIASQAYADPQVTATQAAADQVAAAMGSAAQAIIDQLIANNGVLVEAVAAGAGLTAGTTQTALAGLTAAQQAALQAQFALRGGLVLA